MNEYIIPQTIGMKGFAGFSGSAHLCKMPLFVQLYKKTGIARLAY